MSVRLSGVGRLDLLDGGRDMGLERFLLAMHNSDFAHFDLTSNLKNSARSMSLTSTLLLLLFVVIQACSPSPLFPTTRRLTPSWTAPGKLPYANDPRWKWFYSYLLIF